MAIIERFLLALFKKRLVRNYRRFCTEQKGRALLYYKTDAFALPWIASRYAHTNLWESLEMAKTLNALGYWVDILDRTARLPDIESLEDVYDVYIGIGSGDSGKHFAAIAKKVRKALKILYTTGANPKVSRERMRERYDRFLERHPGAQIEMRRLVSQTDINANVREADALFSIAGEYARESFQEYGKPLYAIYPSTSPALASPLTENEIRRKKANSFLYFGGNGNIAKGLDLVIEAFEQLPGLQLYICAPYEKDFMRTYRDSIKKARNIHWMGFIPVGSKTFMRLSDTCAFVILPSATEGISTSVASCMRRGLIPIVTYESGIDPGSFGYLIAHAEVPALSALLEQASTLTRDELGVRSAASREASESFTQQSFSGSFRSALVEVLGKKQ